MNIFKRLLLLITTVSLAFLPYFKSLIFYDEGEVFEVRQIEANTWQGDCVFINGKKEPFTLEKGECLNDNPYPGFCFDEELLIRFNMAEPKAFNYYGISLKTNKPLKGIISYNLAGKEYSEEFFVNAVSEAGDFFSFIDSYFDRHKGLEIKSLYFENLGSEKVELFLYGLDLYNRKVLAETVYISDGNFKIGVSLKWGGSLSYAQYLRENIQAVKTKDGVKVGIDALKNYGGLLLTSKVNLINRNDTGRVVQQSYYGTNGSNDEYERSEFMGHMWPYNPVQGGNKYNDASKIVDCRVGDDYIYIKCRPMDWAKPADCITSSYIEATYALKEGLIQVDCKFTDFSGWTPTYTAQEVPAFYPIEPLNSFRFYEGGVPWQNDENIRREDDLIFWAEAHDQQYTATEYWSAWTNTEEDAFGLGLYVPEVPLVKAGVFDRGGNIKRDPSRSGPTSYTAAIHFVAVESFKPLEYSYLIAAGKVSQIRERFAGNKNLIDNQKLINY